MNIFLKTTIESLLNYSPIIILSHTDTIEDAINVISNFY